MKIVAAHVAYVGDRTQCEDGTFDLVICCDASIS